MARDYPLSIAAAMWRYAENCADKERRSTTMTTKTDTITPPPLPHEDFVDPGRFGVAYSANTMIAYARAAATPYAEALRGLIEDLELRSKLKRGGDHGTVDCGQGAYERAKRALGELDG